MKSNDFDMSKIIDDMMLSKKHKPASGSEMIDKSRKDRLLDKEKEMFPKRLYERFKTLQGRGNPNCKSQTALGIAFYSLFKPEKDIPGSPDQIIRDWRQGKRLPKDKQIKCLAEILDCYPDYLLGYRQEANEREFPAMYQSREDFESAKDAQLSASFNANQIEFLLNRFGYFCYHNYKDDSIDVDSICATSSLNPEALDYKIPSENHIAFLKDVQNYLDFLILKYSSPIKYWEDDSPILAQYQDRKNEENKSK